MQLKKKWREKKMVVFDLDGTLTHSKAPLSILMVKLLLKLLEQKPVAIISGGHYLQFEKQILGRLSCPPRLLKRLFLFPTTGSAFYRYADGWKLVYEHEIAPHVRRDIMSSFHAVFTELGYEHPAKTYGEVIQDRRTQVTFSALGQDIVAALGPKRGVALKLAFHKTGWRGKIAKQMQKRFPTHEVRTGGYSSIDVVAKGINKAYGLFQIEKELGIQTSEMLFIGDGLHKGGNDYAVRQTSADWIAVKGPAETAQVVRFLLK